MTTDSLTTSAPATGSRKARPLFGPYGLIDGDRLLRLSSPFILLAIWEICARVGYIDQRYFPAPSSILKTAKAMILDGELATHLFVSIQRILVGFVMGAVPGILLGLAMGLWKPVRAVIEPLIDATFPIPKIALLPIFIMLFGLGEMSKYMIIATAVIYLMLINTAAGVRNIDKIYLEVGRNFGAGRLLTFTNIALPGALPMIMAGAKLGLGVALLVIVSAEFVGAKSGIGYLIWTSWQVFEVEKMYVGLATSSLLGIVSAALLNWIDKVLIPWKRR
ncbi:MAG: ABC transporter permease [Steroidobacteraceae bacterium]